MSAAPSEPGSLVIDLATSNGQQNAIISWSPPDGVVDEIVLYSLRWWHYYDGNFLSNHKEFLAVNGKSRYSHSIENLRPGQRYDVNVVAISPIGGSPPVNGFVWTSKKNYKLFGTENQTECIVLTEPGTPTNLRFDQVTATTVTLNWETPVFGAVGYKTFYTHGGVVTFAGYSRLPPYDLKSLIPNSQYSLYVSAFSGPRDDLITSAFSNVINLTTGEWLNDFL